MSQTEIETSSDYILCLMDIQRNKIAFLSPFKVCTKFKFPQESNAQKDQKLTEVYKSSPNLDKLLQTKRLYATSKSDKRKKQNAHFIHKTYLSYHATLVMVTFTCNNYRKVHQELIRENYSFSNLLELRVKSSSFSRSRKIPVG